MVRWNSCASLFVLGEQWVSNSYPAGTHDQGIMSVRSSSSEFSKYYQELGELFPLEQNLPCISADFAYTKFNPLFRIVCGLSLDYGKLNGV